LRVRKLGREFYLVFQRSCAALTLIRAVSSVKGGKGGLDVEGVAIFALLGPLNRVRG